MSPFRFRKPEILRHIPLDEHTVIEASAGTGKTFTLEHLVVALVLDAGIPLEQLLVVTFTEKATGELKSRVRRLLERMLEPRREDEAKAGEDAWVLDEEHRERITAALRGFDSASISTIHAFCRRLLTEHAFENGRLFDEELVDGATAFSETFKDVLRDTFAREPEDRTWLAEWLRGKSLADLEGLLWQCASKTAPILPKLDEAAIRADLAALHALAGRADELASELKARKVHGNTINALRRRLDRFPADLPAGAHLAKLLATAEAYEDADFPNFEKLSDSPQGSLGAQMLSVFGRIRDWPGLAAALVNRFLPPVRERLARSKRESGVFDFDDMLGLVRDRLAAHPPLVQALRSRYRCALIDEFQDTDEIQWEVFRTLFFESDQGHVLYLIGDPKQAIYGFRGADVGTYLLARQQLCGARQPVLLTHNFRSTKPLIEAYNAILDQGAPAPFFSSGDIRYDAPVACGKPDSLALGPDGEPAPPVQILGLSRDNGASKQALLGPLGARIAEEIRRLTSDRSPSLLVDDGEGGTRGVRRREIFILTASRDDGLHVARQLRAAGVPYAFYKQDGLFQSEEAEAILDLLEAIAHPDDRARRGRAWLGPFFGVPLESLAGLQELEPSHPLMARLSRWAELADARRYEQLFHAVLEESGLTRRLILLDPGERALTNYQHLFEFLLETHGRSRVSIQEIVQALRAYKEERRLPPGEAGNLQRLEGDADAVQILTMHASKGLEAPVVFVAGGFNRAKSGAVARFHDDSGGRALWVGKARGAVKLAVERECLGEYERLLYVAVTRARARLYLPLVPAPEKGNDLDGPYSKLNLRLRDLVAEREDSAELQRLFAFEALEPAAGWSAPQAIEAREAPPLVIPTPPDLRSEYEALRARHSGCAVVSFTSLHHLQADPQDAEREDFDADSAARAEPAEGELPSGSATGNFLHEVLEHLPPGAALRAASADEYGRDPAVARVLGAAAHHHGVPTSRLGHGLRMVHAALATPLDVAGLPPLDSLPLLKEMEFLYPIPEAAHPPLGAVPEGRGFEIRRGFVKGFIDVLFEHQGRAWLADWKSNTLPAYDPATLAEEVARSYAWQVRLYALALVKMLGIDSAEDHARRFGGVLYLFLRGVERGGGQGVHFTRPTWEDVCGWEAELRGRRDLITGGAA